jgi:hypothetical protein
MQWMQENEDAWRTGNDEAVGGAQYRGILIAEAGSNVMRIPPDAVIDEAKFTRYLLVPRPWDDKSGYLRQAGFELENWPNLLGAVRRLADAVDAVDAIEDRTDDDGTFYRVEGVIGASTGPLSVVCIWLKQAVDGKVRFVTLMPAKRRGGNVSTTV